MREKDGGGEEKKTHNENQTASQFREKSDSVVSETPKINQITFEEKSRHP